MNKLQFSNKFDLQNHTKIIFKFKYKKMLIISLCLMLINENYEILHIYRVEGIL